MAGAGAVLPKPNVSPSACRLGGVERQDLEKKQRRAQVPRRITKTSDELYPARIADKMRSH